VLGDGVVADDADAPLGPEVPDDEAGQDGRQGQGGPLSQGEDTVVAGRVAIGQLGDGAEQVGHGAPAGGQDGGDAQQPGAGKGGGAEGGAKQGEERQFLACYTTHTGLRVGDAWAGLQPP
jgi:hypothetical protein